MDQEFELHVTATQPSLWRAGRQFGPTPVIIARKDLTAEEYDRITGEPKLIWHRKPVSKPEAIIEPAPGGNAEVKPEAAAEAKSAKPAKAGKGDTKAADQGGGQ